MRLFRLARAMWSPALLMASVALAPAKGIAFTVASVKVMPLLGQKEKNFGTFAQLAREAAAKGANLIVTPEGFLDGYAGGGPKQHANMDRAKLAALAEPIDGPTLRKVAALARELKVHIL